MVRRRLDAELVRRGLAASRAEARSAVRDGLVTVSGRRADKPSTLVDPADTVDLRGPARRYVSRGGDKLEAALRRFRIDPTGARCLDAGASTGGFTDCLLRHGAGHVVALDVGYGQLAWGLRSDDRVSVLERTNVRGLTPAHLPYAPDLVVADLSFISLGLAIPALVGVAAPTARFVLLVKPQFEAGRDAVGHGGVVRDRATRRRAIEVVADACREAGLATTGFMASPLRGPAGNVEFFLDASRPAQGAVGIGAPEIEAALDEGERVGG